MTQSVAQADPHGAFYRWLFGWGNWVPPVTAPELTPAINEWDGPWRDTVSHRKVELDRTAALDEVDMPIAINAGKAPHQGSSYGYPINLADKRRNVAVKNLSTVHDADDIAEVRVLPIPTPVRIEGDPAGAFDRHLKVVDPIDMVCWEAIQAHVTGEGVNVGYTGSGDGLTRWDMSERWTVDSPGLGVVAANVPHTPLLALFDNTVAPAGGLAHGLKHTLPLVLPTYSDDDPVGWARWSDGEDSRHPLRAGDILRLSCIQYIRLCNRFAAGTPERAIIDALFVYGMIVVDKRPGKLDASLSLTQDRRWATLREMGLRLTMFEVVV